MLFVKGFFKDSPHRLTDIQDVSEVTGLTINEVKKVYNVLDIDLKTIYIDTALSHQEKEDYINRTMGVTRNLNKNLLLLASLRHHVNIGDKDRSNEIISQLQELNEQLGLLTKP